VANNDLFQGFDEVDQFQTDSLKSQIKNSNYVNQDTTPDFEADTIKLAKEVNMPTEFIKRNYNVLKKDKQNLMPDTELDDLVKSNPSLAKFIADPENNGVAKDDMDNLKEQENLAKDRFSDSKFFNMATAMNAQITKGIATLPETVVSLAQFPVNLVTQKVLNRPDLELKPEQVLPNNFLYNYYDDVQKKATAKIPELQINVGQMAAEGKFAEMSKGIAYQALLNAPTSVATIAATAYASPAVATAYVFGTTFGPKTIENKEADVDQTTNTYNAILNSAAETIFERVADTAILKSWGNQMTSIIGKQKTADVIKEASKIMAKSYGVEAGGEALTQGFQSGADFATGVNPDALNTMGTDVLGAGLIGGFSGAAFTAPTAAAITTQKLQMVRSAEADKNFIEKLGDAVSRSKLRERGLTDKNKFYIDSITENQGTDTVYVDGEKLEEFFQSKGESISSVFSQLGLNKEYEAFSQTGGDIAIKTSDFVDKFVGTEFYQAISGDVKFNPDGLTYNQALDDAKKTQETMKSVMTELQDNPDRIAAAEKMEADLIATGMNKQEARYSASMSLFLPVLAERTGRSLESLQQEYGVKIQSGVAPGQGELNQKQSPADINTPEFKKFFGNSKVVDDSGKPLVVYHGSGKEFSEFKFKQLNDRGYYGEGYYFSPQQSDANFYAEMYSYRDQNTGGEFNPQIYPVYLSLQNPYVVYKNKFSGPSDPAAFTEKLKSLGYDGVIVKNQDFDSQSGQLADEWIQEIVAFEPNQIKSVNNNGSFDLNNPKIYFQATKLPGAERSDLGFYSKLEQTVIDKVPANASGEQILGTLKDVKAEELEFSGLKEFLKGKKKVSKEDLLAFVRGNNLQVQEVVLKDQPAQDFVNIEDGIIDDGVPAGELTPPTKFSQYVLPGGENYREVLFTFPSKNEGARRDELAMLQRERKLTEAEQAEYQDLRNRNVGYDETKYKSSHFDQPNILAHTRLTDRIDADGKKVLFVEEIQSDWHQAGRDKGYKFDEFALVAEAKKLRDEREEIFKDPSLTSSSADEFTSDLFNLTDEEFKVKYPINPRIEEIDKRVGEIEKELRVNTGSVHNAPFKKTWHEFALKRIVQMAVENGYDRVSWTTGDQQADRYKNALLEKVDKFFVKKNEDDTYDLIAENNGSTVTTEKNITKARVFDLVGKSLGDQLVHSADTTEGVATLEGTDFNIGGEGMRGFYDKILVNSASKLFKKFGVKVVEGKVNIIAQDRFDYFGPEFTTDDIRKKLKTNITASVKKSLKLVLNAMDKNGYPYNEAMQIFGNPSGAEAMGGKMELAKKTDTVHTIDITQELKDAAINQGFELYQGTGEYRGSYNPKERLIKLFAQKNKSTFLHESAHYFLDVLMQESARSDANENIKKDFAEILKFLGVESTDKIEVEQHEKFARGFEAYLREGNAPSLSLKKAFNSFKKWLTKIYPFAQMLKVELTPEIRGVFDRILATDAEIEEARQALDMKTTLTPDIMKTLGYISEEIEALLTANEDWILAAEAKMYSKLEAQAEAQKRKEFKDLVNKYTEEYKEFLKDNPIYKAIDGLKDSVKILRSTAPGLNSKYTSKTEGMPVQVVAEMFGFRNTEDFIFELNNTKDLETEARERGTEAAKQEFEDVGLDVKSIAMESLHNVKREDLLRLELDNILKSKEFKTAVKKTVRRVPPKAEIKQLARTMIGEIKVNAIKPYLYTRAMVKNARLAGEALAKGDISKAAEYKYKEYLNHELALAAKDANDTVEKSLRKFKKLEKSAEDMAKTRDIDLVNAAKAVLAKFGIGKDESLPTDYLNNLKKYAPEKHAVIQNLIGDALEGAGPYEQASFEDFMEMKTAVDALTELAKIEKKSEIDGKKVEFESIKQELIEQALKLDQSGGGDKYKKTADKYDKFKSRLASSAAALKRVEFWADVMDLGMAQGPFKKYIFNPISEAVAKYRLKKEEVIKKYKQINERYKDIFTQDKIDADEIGFQFRNKGELLMALLHSGNESNKSKLLRGRGWGSINEDGTLNSTDFDAMLSRLIKSGVIVKADMDYVQEIWDLMESLKPESQKAHKDMFGYYFNEITAKPIFTPFGEYKGGYIPAKVDTYENEDAKIRQERNEFEEGGLGMSFLYPTTGKGFTKSRIDAYAAPLSLDLNLLAGHIDSSLRFTYIEPRVKEVAKLVYNKEFRAILSKVDPNVGSDVLIPWLQRSASQQVVVPSTGYFKVIDSVASYLRSAVAMQIMVGNVSNALQQFTGTIVASSKVKPKHLLASTVMYMKDVKGSVENMLDKSDYMRSTQGNKLFESMQRIEEITTNPTVFENVRNFAKEHTYFLQTATQNIVNTIVWTGAYNEAIADGMTESQAVKAADRAIRTTQGSVLAEDISAFEVGSPTYRLFTQFAGYFNMLANLNSSEVQKIRKTVGLKKGASKMFYLYLTAFMLPAVISDIIVKGMRGEFGEGDDEELMMTWLDSFFGSQFRTATATTPMVGPLLNTVVGKFTDQPFDDRLSLSPVLSVLEGVAGVPNQIYKGLTKDQVNEKKVLKDVLMLTGIASNLPIAPLGKPLGYLMDVESGKARPSGPVDFARGLVSGQPGK
jgi:hypothetical protein